MPASRKDIKSPRTHRREQSSPIIADGSNGIPSSYDYSSESESSAVMSTRSGTPSSVAGTEVSVTAATGTFNDEQLKLRAMIPALTVSKKFLRFLSTFF
jgi:hypothetical protein